MSLEFRTVLISADCATRFDSAVESGVELARILQLGLAGVFVEEDALLDFSALPFSRVIQTGWRGARSLDPEAMRHAMEREGRRLRAELARLAEQSNLSWRFEVGRGRPAEAIGRVAQVGDIVVLQMSPAVESLRARLETARALLAQGSSALLTPEQMIPRGGAVTVLVEGAAQAAALALAARIAARLEERLVINFWPAAAGDAGAIAHQIAELQAGKATVELNLRKIDRIPEAKQLEAPQTRLIVSQWSLVERLGLINQRSQFGRRGTSLLLLPEETNKVAVT